jgi:hypothetical protein
MAQVAAAGVARLLRRGSRTVGVVSSLAVQNNGIRD